MCEQTRENKIDQLKSLKNKIEKSECNLKDIASNLVFSTVNITQKSC